MKNTKKVNAKSLKHRDKITEESLRGMLINPIYAGLGPYPAIVDDATWIAANKILIERDGAEQYLVNLLHVLRETFGHEES
jgi:hypothetical protein